MLASKRLMFEAVIEQTARGKMKPRDLKSVNILDHTAIDDGSYSIAVFMQDGRSFYAQGSRNAAYDNLYNQLVKRVCA